MNKEQQDKYRAALIEKYEQRVFESFAQYNYWGKKFSALDNQAKDYEKRILEAKVRINEIEAGPDRYSRVQRPILTSLREDIARFDKMIANMTPTAEKLQKEAQEWQQEGIQKLEQIDELKAMVLKTPDEITKDRAEKELKEQAAATDSK